MFVGMCVSGKSGRRVRTRFFLQGQWARMVSTERGESQSSLSLSLGKRRLQDFVVDVGPHETRSDGQKELGSTWHV